MVMARIRMPLHRFRQAQEAGALEGAPPGSSLSPATSKRCQGWTLRAALMHIISDPIIKRHPIYYLFGTVLVLTASTQQSSSPACFHQSHLRDMTPSLLAEWHRVATNGKLQVGLSCQTPCVARLCCIFFLHILSLPMASVAKVTEPGRQAFPPLHFDRDPRLSDHRLTKAGSIETFKFQQRVSRKRVGSVLPPQTSWH